MTDRVYAEHLRAPSCATLAAVVLRVLEDAAAPGWRRDCRYSPRAALEKIVNRGESVASGGDAPSYLWFTIGLDEDGFAEPRFDLGRLPESVVRERVAGQTRRFRVSAPRYIVDWAGPWDLLAGDGCRIGPLNTEWRTSASDVLLYTGLELGRRYLLRVVSRWYRCSYEYDEWDEDRDVELVYAEPRNPGTPIYLPYYPQE